MEIYNKLVKLAGILAKPLELANDWAREPLRKWDHERKEALSKAEHKRKLELQESMINSQSKTKIKEREEQVNQEIRRKTAVIKIIAELEEWKKDKELERMGQVSKAIIRYQAQLSKLNVNAINTIGHMQLEHRERAQNLVYENTRKFKELQDLELKDAMDYLGQIEKRFAKNEAMKNILTEAIGQKLTNIISTADDFLKELNNDIKDINQSTTMLAENGQRFIERHLERHYVAELPLQEKDLLPKNLNKD